MREPELTRKPELMTPWLGAQTASVSVARSPDADSKLYPNAATATTPTATLPAIGSASVVCLSTFGPLAHIFPQVTMPRRSTQQDLRNFEAISLTPEPLDDG